MTGSTSATSSTAVGAVELREVATQLGSKPHRVVAVGGARVAENIAGDDLGGRRSSGEAETEAAGHGEARGMVLRAPGSAWKTKACSDSSLRACGHGGGMAGRAELSASMAEGVGGRGRAQGEGRKKDGLTAVAGGRTASSGKGWSEWVGEGDLR